MSVISGVFIFNGKPTNGATAKLWKATGFEADAELTEVLRPNAVGDLSELVMSGGGFQNWDRVDEEVSDDDSSYVYRYHATIADYKSDLYNLPASSGSGTINHITVYVRCRATGGTTGKCNAKVKSGTTTAEGDEDVVATDYVTYSHQWATNPDDSEAWEWSDIDDLQIGVRCYNEAGYAVRCTQVYVEVDYTIRVPVPPSLDTAEPDVGYQYGSTLTTSVDYGSDGAFRWTAVPAGEYYVSVEYDGKRAWLFYGEPTVASILTTAGDLLVRGASVPQRLAKGSDGQKLRMISGVPTWG